MSRGFGVTLRRAPADVEDTGYETLLRAAYLRQTGPGLFSYLPLGRRSLLKLEELARSEMARIGAHEVSLPLLQPRELWQRSGVLRLTGPQLLRCEDRHGRGLIIASSNEAAAAELIRSEVSSHRQLPVSLFRIGRVFRSEERPRAGPLRAREFTMLDSYSFARDDDELAEAYDAHLIAFRRILARLQLPDARLAGASARGGSGDRELVYPLESGDDSVVVCDACGYIEKSDTARFVKPEPAAEAPAGLEKVATPNAATIAALARTLSVPVERTAKVVFLQAARGADIDAEPERRILLMALVRGDMELSEAKLRAVTGTLDLRTADAGAIRAVGAEPGYASPIGLDPDDLLVVVDDLVAASPNLISGANEEGYHYRNVNYGRDYEADVVADIAAIPPGAACAECGGPLRRETCVELASLHRFPAEFGEWLGLTYQDESRALATPRMASYGIGIDRLLACVASVHHDERGLRLPLAAAPFQVLLVSLPAGDAILSARSDALYESLQVAGYEVLYDDREASAGVKFNDADLIGVPLRLTLGARSLEAGGVELRRRDAERGEIVALDDVAQAVSRAIDQLSSTLP
jgi:prolyl-tRNA synthetase